MLDFSHSFSYAMAENHTNRINAIVRWPPIQALGVRNIVSQWQVTADYPLQKRLRRTMFEGLKSFIFPSSTRPPIIWPQETLIQLDRISSIVPAIIGFVSGLYFHDPVYGLSFAFGAKYTFNVALHTIINVHDSRQRRGRS